MRIRLTGNIAALGIVGLLAVGAIFWLRSQTTPIAPPPGPTISAIDYSDDVERLVQRAAHQSQEALAQFHESLGTVLASYEPKFEGAARQASVTTAKYDSIAVIVYYLAWDQLTGEQRTDVYLNQQLGPLLGPVIEDFARDVNHTTATLENDLKKISVQLATDLAALGLGDSPPPLRLDSPEEIGIAFDAALRNLGLNAAAVGVAVAFDAAAIANSQLVARILRAISSLTARLFAKQVAKVAASIGAAVADGPLPVGDIVGAVGLIWTAIEIWRLQDNFQAEVFSSSMVLLTGLHADVDGKARSFAASKLSESASLQAEIGSRSLQELME